MPTKRNSPPLFETPYRHRPGSPFFNDGGEAKLFRMIEEQLNENEYEIDFEKLIHSFQQEDREVRGTLSADQVSRTRRERVRASLCVCVC